MEITMAENENIEKKPLSAEGLKKYEDELNYLKVTRREEIAEKIKEAREQGDLSENAEYDAAKDEQRDIEARIFEIENIIKNSYVVENKDLKKGVVNIGCRDKLLDEKHDEELEYYIVGASEADSLNGKISNESPLGNALMGKKKDDVVTLEFIKGKPEYRILKVSSS